MWMAFASSIGFRAGSRQTVARGRQMEGVLYRDILMFRVEGIGFWV